ncbi:MAG: hypothetical protein K2M94_04600 [Paramuribaculum sp.]|nr:hypothetical protein [Paramuribaculum sp.]
MKTIFNVKASVFNIAVALFIAISGTVLISSCDSTSSVTYDEAVKAGETFGRMISGN